MSEVFDPETFIKEAAAQFDAAPWMETYGYSVARESLESIGIVIRTNGPDSQIVAKLLLSIRAANYLKDAIAEVVGDGETCISFRAHTVFGEEEG